MAWEKRGNHSYYYRKERIGGKVRSNYVGNSETALLIAQLDRIEAARRELAEHEVWAEREKHRELDRQLEEISATNRNLVDALFLINGYHQHKRQWRRKRK